MVTPVSFSPEALPFQKLVNVLLEIESHQTQTVPDILIYVNLVESPLETDSSLSDVRGGRLRGRGFRPRIQCQIYGYYGHLA